MTNNEDWRPFQWHCSNCGNLVTGYKNEKGDIKVECKRCRTCMVRKLKTKTHDTIEVYAPRGMVHVGGGQ